MHCLSLIWGAFVQGPPFPIIPPNIKHLIFSIQKSAITHALYTLCDLKPRSLLPQLLTVLANGHHTLKHAGLNVLPSSFNIFQTHCSSTYMLMHIWASTKNCECRGRIITRVDFHAYITWKCGGCRLALMLQCPSNSNTDFLWRIMIRWYHLV